VPYYVYILARGRRGTIYVGVTNDLVRRVYEHRTDAVPGFTRKYQIHRLVYYEIHDDIREAISREKTIKRWARAWKIELIEKENLDWVDLWPTLGHGRMSGAEAIHSTVIPAKRRAAAREPGPISLEVRSRDGWIPALAAFAVLRRLGRDECVRESELSA